MVMLTEAAEVRRCLRWLEERVGDGEDAEAARKNLNDLICLFDSPLFCRLLSVEDSLDALREVSHKQPLDENDFDIDVSTGELVLLKQRDRTGNVGGALYSEPRRYQRPVEDKNVNLLRTHQHVAEVHTSLSDVGVPVPVPVQNLPPGCAIESVSLDKPDGVGVGLGFGIAGLRSDSAELGVYIQSIQHGGVADR